MEDMVEYATVSINVDSRGMARLLIKQNVADAMKLKNKAEKKERLMAIYDDKKQTLTIIPTSVFEKRYNLG